MLDDAAVQKLVGIDKWITVVVLNLLGNYVNGVLHLDVKQYCGNGFEYIVTNYVHFRRVAMANIIGVEACPKATKSGAGGKVRKHHHYDSQIHRRHSRTRTSANSERKRQNNNAAIDASDFANNDPRTLTLDFVNPTVRTS